MQSQSGQLRNSDTEHADKPGTAGNKSGLVLEDFLRETGVMRRQFRLPTPNFGVKEIEQYLGAREAFEKLIQDTIDRHGSEVYSKPDPLLSEISTDIYSKPVAFAAYSGCKIPPKWIAQSLRKLLEIGLQTVVQLASREPKADYGPRKLRLLASHFSKVAEEADAVLQQPEASERILAYFRGKGEADRDRLSRLAEEMRWAADTLGVVISQTRAVKTGINSPNPQVNFALYMTGWLQASTGREQYERLATLIRAAFSAAGKEQPKWVDRLAVEMYRKRRRREKYALSLEVSPPNA